MKILKNRIDAYGLQACGFAAFINCAIDFAENHPAGKTKLSNFIKKNGAVIASEKELAAFFGYYPYVVRRNENDLYIWTNDKDGNTFPVRHIGAWKK